MIPTNLDEPIVIGNEGGVECPAGYSLITAKDMCQEKAPSAIGKTFHSQGCWEFEANGCFVNNGKDVGKWNNYVFFNHCNSIKRTTNSGYAPVCEKGMLEASQNSKSACLASIRKYPYYILQSRSKRENYFSCDKIKCLMLNVE